MCDPFTLAASAGLGALSKIVSGNEAYNNAQREAQARNAVLKDTLAKESGYAANNTTEMGKNVANYAPGAQEAQLASSQGARSATATGNITQSDPNAVPITSDAPPAVRGEIAKRMMAVHDGAVNRAKLSANLGGFGDTWLKNNLNTSEADRNIGVNNNYAEGQKAILQPMQDAAAASVYKAPSVWSTLLGGASSIAAGAAGAGKGLSSLGGGAAPTGGTGINLTATGSLY